AARLQHAALALDLRDAAVGGDEARVDVVADHLLVAGVDEDFGDRRILRGRRQAVAEGGETRKQRGERDQLTPPPQHAADQGRLDFPAGARRRALPRRRGGKRYSVRRRSDLGPHTPVSFISWARGSRRARRALRFWQHGFNNPFTLFRSVILRWRASCG